MNETDVEHIPVLADVLAEQIILPLDGVMVDATIGQGGHSCLFGQSLSENGILTGLDVDEKAITKAKERLQGLRCKVIVKRFNFSQISEALNQTGIQKADFILADLGVSSGQLADKEAGLSFAEDMTLDMRIDKRLKVSAADIVNRKSEKELADLIYEYGEERASRRIARFIVHHRKIRPIKTTGRLADIVCEALGKRKQKIHPATRTFQALRIAVNNELENLKGLLESAPGLLKKGGKIAVISYHSLEDRLVKQDFVRNKEAGFYGIITKKPIVPTREEILRNRRSRSAKLRIAERIGC